MTARIKKLEGKIEQIARIEYPETQLLTQVHGVGTLIALTFVLTLEDRERFQKSRDVGCYVGLRPKQSESGQSQPQLRITKEGDRYLRTLLVQGAHLIMNRRGPDTDLKRWGRKLAERGGKNAKSGPSWRWRGSWRCCCTGCGCAEKCTNRCATAGRRPLRTRQPKSVVGFL